jgi:hypothetical protein
MVNKKIISFSLWGDNPKYTLGAIKNAKLASTIYSNWICRYYIGLSTPTEIVDELKHMNNTEIVIMNEQGDWNSMFWRFLPIGDNDIDVMLSRDCDSRLSIREKLCVDEFINSDKMFHNMIDHPFHNGIMGGMWGAKKGVLNNMKELIDNWPKTNQWQTDQSFLNTIVTPIIGDNIFIHDSINKRNFPIKRKDYEYVGESYNGYDERSEHWCVFTFDEYKHLD